MPASARREGVAFRAVNDKRHSVAVDETWAMQMLARLGDIAFVLDPDGTVEWRRELRPGATGTPDHEVEGGGMFDRVHPDDMPSALSAFTDLVAGTRERVELDVRIRYANRLDDWMLNRLTAVRLPDGRVGALARVLDDDLQVDLDTPAAPGFSIAEVAPIGLALFARADLLMYANTAFTTATGLALGPLTGDDVISTAVVGTATEGLRDGRATREVSTDDLHLVVGAHRLGRSERSELLVTVQDVTELSDLRAARRTADQLFTTAFENAPAGMALVDASGVVLRVNAAFGDIVGHTTDELVRRLASDLWHPADAPDTARLERRLRQGQIDSYRTEMRFRNRDGHAVWVELRVGAARQGDGSLSHTIAQVTDITTRRLVEEQRRANEAALLHRATHDPLTDLPNRALLAEHLRLLIARVRRETEDGAVLFCDLDGFKAVNDTHGHAVGDRVLVTVAERLRSVVRATDLVARVGGDEFVIALAATDHPEGVAAVARRIHEILSEPTDDPVAGPVSCGVSLGVARVSADDDDASVVHRADSLAYEAKRGGGGIRQED